MTQLNALNNYVLDRRDGEVPFWLVKKPRLCMFLGRWVRKDWYLLAGGVWIITGEGATPIGAFYSSLLQPRNLANWRA